jgi:putative membrane protein
MTQLNRITCILLLAFLAATAARGVSETTLLLIASSILMFAVCWVSATHLLGARAAASFVIIAVVIGWVAEEMGANYGWFFGDYHYTDVLGPTLGTTPVVIPLMWFALCYTAYVLANLIVWQTPSDGVSPAGKAIVLSLLAALLVTAYDLGADPYMVYKLKAWIMTKKDGWWFGETLQGFAGWATISFTIIFLFRLSLRRWPPAPKQAFSKLDMGVPLTVYGGSMLFQMFEGTPVETRTIAFFAMGIPLLCAVCGLQRWQYAVEQAPVGADTPARRAA